MVSRVVCNLNIDKVGSELALQGSRCHVVFCFCWHESLDESDFSAARLRVESQIRVEMLNSPDPRLPLTQLGDSKGPVIGVGQVGHPLGGWF